MNPHSDVNFLVVEPEVANEAEESVRLQRPCAIFGCSQGRVLVG